MVSLFHSGLGWGAGLGFGGGWGLIAPALLWILSSGYWHQGIVPGICLYILHFKAKLILGPAIGLGVFVLGKGAGLLIGKLLGIKYIIRKLRPKHTHYHLDHGQGWHPHGHLKWPGWKPYRPKPFFHSFGWKPWQLRFRLPFYIHKSHPPQPHHDFHAYPPIHVKYAEKPYGTYNHQHESDSGWIPGKPASSGWTPSNHEESSHVYNQGGSEYSQSSGSSSYTSSHGDEEVSGSDIHENGEYLRTKKASLEALNDDLETEPTEVEAYILREAEKLKSGKFNLTESSEEILKFQELMNDEFTRDLLDSLGTKTIPEFVRIPNEEIDPLNLNGTTARTVSNSTEYSKDKQPMMTSLTPSVIDSLFGTIKNVSPANFIPDSLMSWLMSGTETGVKMGAHEKSRRRRETMATTNEVKVNHLTRAILTDIRNLFNIVGFLDINRCIEKMVCEIHSRGRNFVGREIDSSFEGKIITAFKVMESLMPEEEPGSSTTLYRKAAQFGEKEGARDACEKTFSECKISTNQLIRFGNLVDPSMP